MNQLTVPVNANCPIWPVQRAYVVERRGDSNLYKSPRTGGLYSITSSAEALLRVVPLKADHAIRLTSWLVAQRKLGIETPNINSSVLEKIPTFRRPSPTEMPDLLLQHLDKHTDHFGHQLNWDREEQEIALAWTGALDTSALLGIHRICRDFEWISYQDVIGGIISTEIKFKGYQRLEELSSINADSRICFVAMWFDPSIQDAYDNGIAKGIEDAGYDPFIVNKQEHSDKIDDFIIAGIRRSRFVVADFTSEIDKPRGGVYYEAGFAQGLGLPVIWTVRADMIDNIHFDTRQYNHITWSDPDDLRKQLSVRISAVIGDGPNKTA